MVASSNNIAEELYSLLVSEPYEQDVQTIDADTQPTPEELKKIKKLLNKAYKLDTSRFQTRRGNCVPNGMYELFGDYSGKDAQAIRDELYDWLQDKNNEVQEVVTKAMQLFPHRSLTGWLMTMRNAKYAGDELTLYALCKLHLRHVVVYTMSGLWTTIKDGLLLGESELVTKCDIILFHLGGYWYGVLTELEHTNKRLKVKTIDSLRDELIYIRQSTDKSYNTRPRKKLNYKDLSEGRSPTRPARKQPYKPLPGLGPSEIQMSAQETIDEIRKSRVVGSVTIKIEDKKPKIKSKTSLSSSNTKSLKRSETEGHCPKHCPKAKKKKTEHTDPEDILPDLPTIPTVETFMPATHSENLSRPVVTTTETTTTSSTMKDNTDTGEAQNEPNAALRSVATTETIKPAGGVIEIVPTTDATMELETERIKTKKET